MLLKLGHSYEISHGFGETITGTVKKIGRTYIYLDNCTQFTGIAERYIGKFKIEKDCLDYVKEVY